jgi:hypothetical protein
VFFRIHFFQFASKKWGTGFRANNKILFKNCGLLNKITQVKSWGKVERDHTKSEKSRAHNFRGARNIRFEIRSLYTKTLGSTKEMRKNQQQQKGVRFVKGSRQPLSFRSTHEQRVIKRNA